MPRWLITAPMMLMLTVAITLALPLLIPLFALVSVFPASRGALRAGLFITSYLWCETLGILVSGWLWLEATLWRRSSEWFLDRHYRLQRWWSNALKQSAERLFQLDFRIHGAEHLKGPGAILLPRHASMADTVIPMTYYAIPEDIRLRYVLKRELLWDPCLEIVGKRLPNYFVDRDSRDTDRETEGVAALLDDMTERDGVLLYPEGTRFTRAKHTSLLERSPEGQPLHNQLLRWPDLLPPRLGGSIALLANNPGKDVLFCAHSGFGGSANFSELMNGAWTRSRVDVAFWRVPFSAVPKDPEGQRMFLFEQWDRMQQTLVALRDGDHEQLDLA